MILAIENSTLSTLAGRFANPAVDEGLPAEESITAKSTIEYYYSIPVAALAVVVIIVVLLCMKRDNVSIIRMRHPYANTESGNDIMEWQTNRAYENDAESSEQRYIDHLPNNGRISQPYSLPNRMKPIPVVSKEYTKVRPVGMATRIPHKDISGTSASEESASAPKNNEAPLRQHKTLPQMDLMKSIVRYHHEQKVNNEQTAEPDDQDSSSRSSWLRSATLDSSPTFQRLKYGSLHKPSNQFRTASPSNSVDMSVLERENRQQIASDYLENTASLNRYKTLYPDPIYDMALDNDSSPTKHLGYGYNTIDHAGQRGRRRGPMLHEAGTAWAIENHLTKEKPKVKSRIPSRRHIKSSFKHTYANSSSLEDLPAELRGSASQLNIHHEVDSAEGSKFSPYKLQVQHPVRRSKKILYRNGTRKQSNKIKRKMSKQLSKNFELGVVEESTSFYMGFDTPLPPAIEKAVATPVRKTSPLPAETLREKNHSYEEVLISNKSGAVWAGDKAQAKLPEISVSSPSGDFQNEQTEDKRKRKKSSGDPVKLVLALTLSQRRRRGGDVQVGPSASTQAKTEVVLGRIVDGYLVPDQPQDDPIYLDLRSKTNGESLQSEPVFVRTERLHTGATTKPNKRRLKSKTLNDFVSDRHTQANQDVPDGASQTEYKQNNTTDQLKSSDDAFMSITKLPSNSKTNDSKSLEKSYAPINYKKKGLFGLRDKKKEEKEAKRLQLKKTIEVVRKHDAKENPYWTIPSA